MKRSHHIGLPRQDFSRSRTAWRVLPWRRSERATRRLIPSRTSSVNLTAAIRSLSFLPTQRKQMSSRSKLTRRVLWSAERVRMKCSIIALGMTHHPRSKLRSRMALSIRSTVMSRIAPFQLGSLAQRPWTSLPEALFSQRIRRWQLMLLHASAPRASIHVHARTMPIQSHHRLTNLSKLLHKERPGLTPNKIRKRNFSKLLMMLLKIFKTKLELL